MAGADPTDRETFTAAVIPRLRVAVEELSWLLGRGYAEGAAATLVGDHHQLDRRQRLAIRRCACTDAQRTERAARRVAPGDLGARPVAIDGFNQLVTIERGLAGGAVLRGRDGALRDVAGVHGSWRRSDHSAEALRRLTRGLVGPATFVLDAPVSNAGRLAAVIRELAGDRPWTVELSDNADRRLLELAREGAVLATSDGALLDRCGAWVPLVERALGDAWVVDLGAHDA